MLLCLPNCFYVGFTLISFVDLWCKEAMSFNETLKGVTVLSGWVIGVNVSLPPLSFIVDDAKDIDSFLAIALPFFFLWLGGLAYGVYRTDDDGYVYGTRSVES